jgi:hypothetical protein
MAPIEDSCSFCHQPKSKVEKLIRGDNGVAICNRCVAFCYDTFGQAGVDVSSRVYAGGNPNIGGENGTTLA